VKQRILTYAVFFVRVLYV